MRRWSYRWVTLCYFLYSMPPSSSNPPAHLFQVSSQQTWKQPPPTPPTQWLYLQSFSFYSLTQERLVVIPCSDLPYYTASLHAIPLLVLTFLVRFLAQALSICMSSLEKFVKPVMVSTDMFIPPILFVSSTNLLEVQFWSLNDSHLFLPTSPPSNPYGIINTQISYPYAPRS
jgi:hypothetical protein